MHLIPTRLRFMPWLETLAFLALIFAGHIH